MRPDLVGKRFLSWKSGAWRWSPDKATHYLLEVVAADGITWVDVKAAAFDYVTGARVNAVVEHLQAPRHRWVFQEPIQRWSRYRWAAVADFGPGEYFPQATIYSSQVDKVTPRALKAAADAAFELHSEGRSWLGDSANAVGDPWWAVLRERDDWRLLPVEEREALRAPDSWEQVIQVWDEAVTRFSRPEGG